MHIFYTNISFFYVLLHVSSPRVRLQEDGCMYSYGTVRFTCSLVPTDLVPTTLLIPMHVKRTIP